MEYILIGIIIGIVAYIIHNKKSYKKIPKVQIYESSPEEKGKAGEDYIIALLGKTIPGQRYLVNNLIISDNNGNSTQIDHIFINSNGVFVIETKNYSGTIYGDDSRKEWTQVFNYGKQKYRFYNPIIQNRNHIKKLIEATGTTLPIKSIVVFANNNIDEINSKNVYTIEGMICEINAYFEEKITPKEMGEFYNKLWEIKANQISDEEHINNVNKTRMTI